MATRGLSGVCLFLLVSPLTALGQEPASFDDVQGVYDELAKTADEFYRVCAYFKSGDPEYLELSGLYSDEHDALRQKPGGFSAVAAKQGEMLKLRVNELAPLFVGGLMKLGSIESAVRRYPNSAVVHWIDGSEVLSEKEMEQSLWMAEKSNAYLTILYRSMLSPSSNEICVFDILQRGMLPDAIGKTYRKDTLVVRRFDGRVVMNRVPQDDDEGYGAPIGFLREQDSRWPAIVFLSGPFGSGHFLRIFTLRVNEETESIWGRNFSDAFSPVSDFEYLPDERIIRLDYTSKFGAEPGWVEYDLTVADNPEGEVSGSGSIFLLDLEGNASLPISESSATTQRIAEELAARWLKPPTITDENGAAPQDQERPPAPVIGAEPWVLTLPKAAGQN